MRREYDPAAGARFAPGTSGSSVLLLSLRRVNRLVAHCMNYEFEDVISQATGADRVDAGDFAALEQSRRAYKLARILSGSAGVARKLAPEPSVVRLDRNYDLFFAVFNHPHELYALATIPNWRQRCRIAACFINEPALHSLPRYLLELLGGFDHIFSGVRNPVGEVQRITGRPCSYLGVAVDVLGFSPLAHPAARLIDVCNIGRRSEVTHQAFLDVARSRNFLYYYDTVAASGFDLKQRTFRVQDPTEHRFLFASLLKRSRYYIANRSRINEPEFTHGKDEISGRFYEGAAAGTVMLGEAPGVEHFNQQFEWPDAVIRLPFDSPDAARIVEELDRDPGRLAAVRARNVHYAALKHDWVHRFRDVLKTLDMAPHPGIAARERRLEALAQQALQLAPGFWMTA